jgi:dipeptidyl-peptidase 4
MKLNKMLFLIVLFVAVKNPAQGKLLTVEDVVLNGYRKFSPSNMSQLAWIPNTETFGWVDGTRDQSSLLSSSVGHPGIDTLLKLSVLNDIVGKEGGIQLKTFPVIEWKNKNEFCFWNNDTFCLFDLIEKRNFKINSVPKESKERSVAPNKSFIAFTVKNNLFINLGEKTVQVTSEPDSNIICGQAVHRNEFGIESGIFWSPDNNCLAFYRMDQRMVSDYPIVDITDTPARLQNIKYPMAGQASHHVTIGIYEIKTGKTVWLQTGEPADQYLTSLTWAPDSKNFYVAHLNRDQNDLRLIKYDISSGEPLKTLFEEKNDKYVEPLEPLVFLPKSPGKFLWNSQRDGFNHLYLYDTDGNLIKQVTSGKWVVTSFDGFDNSGKNIFITSTKESPLEKHFYRVSIAGDSIANITPEAGTHRVIPCSGSDYFIDSYNNVSTPRIINLIDKNGTVVRNLLKAENPLKDYKIGATRLFNIKNDEGTELFCRMITPPDFDMTKKYPVIIYVYGGPHDQEVTNSFGTGRYFLWFYMMAQKGYIIFTLDNRGSSNRGLEFEQATFRHLGRIEVKDQMAGVDYLKSFQYVDPKRFGVFGWSYGGFMAASLMTRTNGAFKAGVGGGAVIDWKFYEVMYTERYMDTPESNPDGYKEASLLNYAGNLKGKLLLCHGTSDPTVVWQNSLSFVKRCTELNIPLDYFPYVGHGHGVTGSDALHLYNKVTDYFLDNL